MKKILSLFCLLVVSTAQAQHLRGPVETSPLARMLLTNDSTAQWMAILNFAGTDGNNLPAFATLSANNTFTGTNTFSNTNNVFAGDGSGLFNLNLSGASPLLANFLSGNVVYPSADASGNYWPLLNLNGNGNSAGSTAFLFYPLGSTGAANRALQITQGGLSILPPGGISGTYSPELILNSTALELGGNISLINIPTRTFNSFVFADSSGFISTSATAPITAITGGLTTAAISISNSIATWNGNYVKASGAVTGAILAGNTAGNLPTVTYGVGAGTGATCTLDAAANNAAFTVTVVTGSNPQPSATIFTVSFGSGAYTTAPHVCMTPLNTVSGSVSGVYVSATSPSGMSVSGGPSTGLSVSTTYQWSFVLVQ